MPAPDLLELLVEVRRTLLTRGEALPATWPEEAVDDLRQGRIGGWVLFGASGLRGIAIVSHRPHRSFAHVHVTRGADPVGTGELLLLELGRRVPVGVNRMDAGVTGLTEEEERALLDRLAGTSPFRGVVRHRMERALDLDEPPPARPLPAGLQLLAIRLAPTERLADLDWAAFRGGPDEALVADTAEGNRRTLEGLLAGEMGRVVEEASSAVTDAGGDLVGFVLVAEESSRRAIVQDLAVRPDQRRRGVGSALLARALRALLALGYRHAELWVTDLNTPARGLYERFGFRPNAVATIYRWSADEIAGASGGPSPQRSR